jgi:superfamily II DNA or RNA helicase
MQKGLRNPQIGALHAVLAHWSVTGEPATIVMPTGTGKTETMLAAMLVARPQRLLVVVPTDALRKQIAEKFALLGILPAVDVLRGEPGSPIVGVMRKRPQTADQVQEFFSCCNVVVTTMAVAGTCPPAIQQAMAAHVSNLVIDEAHHISARTWAYFRSHFLEKNILQFTATPFRRDRKVVDGEVIYSFPLKKAQEEGLFQKVNFRPVFEYGSQADADRAIALATVERLQSDLANGFDHLVMARADSIPRAEAVGKCYWSIDADREASGEQRLGVAVVHSERTTTERNNAFQQLASRAVRIIVCVDMFGEGFDLPNLKVAALHDMHKSLAITLQFVGRFARTSGELGDATVIANLATADVEDSLRALYAEDADWNIVLRDLSSGANAQQLKRTEFIKGFEPPPTDIPLQNVTPALSTVVYRTDCDDWLPHLIPETLGEDRLHGVPSINHAEKVAVFVTRELADVKWGDLREIVDSIWDLYIVYWDEVKQLLYIYSSNTQSVHESLARAVCGDKAVLVRGESMFRVFYDVRRLVLLNLGLRHAVGRNIQFTMYVGADVLANLPNASQQNRTKSNMFGFGFQSGSKRAFGCSYRGRVWSNKNAGDLIEWRQWARQVGEKVTDNTIDTATVLAHALIPRHVTARPGGMPVAIQWPYELLGRDEDVVTIEIDEKNVGSLLDTELQVESDSATSPISIVVAGQTTSFRYSLEFDAKGAAFVPQGAPEPVVRVGKRARPMSEAFRHSHPTIFFADGSSLVGDTMLALPEDYCPPFSRDRIVEFDWFAIDITKESQKWIKRPFSVQFRVIEYLTSLHTESPEIVFDDDDTGEAADVISLREQGDTLHVDLYHCKFSLEPTPGARIDDLYVVCGQAQKSAYRRAQVGRLLAHLDQREAKRLSDGGPSRFEKGTIVQLRDIRRRFESLEIKFGIGVVQPGLSKSGASDAQLALLGVTELYLQETYAIPFTVIGGH